MPPSWKRADAIPAFISNVAPECSRQCILQSIQTGYSGLCDASSLPCLCSKYSANGYTVGELGLSCLYTPTCNPSVLQNGSSVYNICAGSANAVVPTHKTITATISPNQSQSTSGASGTPLAQLPAVTITSSMPVNQQQNVDTKLTSFQIAGITIASVSLLVAIIAISLCTVWLRKRRRPLELEDIKSMCEGLSHQASFSSSTGSISKKDELASSRSNGVTRGAHSAGKWPKYYAVSPPTESTQKIQAPVPAHVNPRDSVSGSRHTRRSLKKPNLHVVGSENPPVIQSVTGSSRHHHRQRDGQDQTRILDKGKRRMPPDVPDPPKSPRRSSKGPALSIQIPPNSSPVPEKVRQSHRGRESRRRRAESSSSAYRPSSVQRTSRRRSSSPHRSSSLHRSSSAQRSSSMRRSERKSKQSVTSLNISRPVPLQGSWGRTSFASVNQQNMHPSQRSSALPSDWAGGVSRKATPAPLFQTRDGRMLYSVQSLQSIHPTERASSVQPAEQAPAISTEWHPPALSAHTPPSRKTTPQPPGPETPKPDKYTHRQLRHKESSTSIESSSSCDYETEQNAASKSSTKIPSPSPAPRSPISDLKYPSVPSSSNNRATKSIPRASNSSLSSATPPPNGRSPSRASRLTPSRTSTRTPPRSSTPSTMKPTPSPRTPTWGTERKVAVASSAGGTPASYRASEGGKATPPQFELRVQGEKMERKDLPQTDAYNFF